MIIVAAEANNDGNNIQWLFAVVRQGVCCFICRCFLEDIGVVGGGGGRWGCFYKVVGHRVFSCIQVVLLCWCFLGDILLFRNGSISGHFQWLFLTFIYHYIYVIIHFCLVFVYTFGGFYNCHISTLLQCPVLFFLMQLIYCYRLIYLVLVNYRSH